MAILAKILLSENNSRFREDVFVKDDWYTYLYRKMTERMITPDSYEDFRKNKVSFITFNYDRSLEHFLAESFSNSFTSIPGNMNMVELIPFPFLHVYGVIGKLPWQKGFFRYCHKGNLNLIDQMMENIKIIYEQIPEEIEKIKELIFNAERIIFLGFGYAKENLEVLDIYNILSIRKDRPAIHGTAFGFTKRELQGVCSLFPYKIDLRNVKSLRLLRDIL
jgi:hypothetical protein